MAVTNAPAYPHRAPMSDQNNNYYLSNSDGVEEC